MALEDIGYLKKHSIKESYMFFVDSGNRNRNMNPHPSEYIVQFSAPYKYVFALEVLDASIPRTQYAVDEHNNKFVYVKNGDLVEKEIPVGDYTDLKFIQIFNETLEGEITISNKSVPGDEKSKFIFESLDEFEIIRDLSTIRTVIGFDLQGLKDEPYPSMYSYKDTQIFGSLYTSDVREIVAYEGPLNVGIYEEISNDECLSQQFKISSENVGDIHTIEIGLVENRNVKFGYIIVDSGGNEKTGGQIDVLSSEISGTITIPTSTIYFPEDTYTLMIFGPKDTNNNPINNFKIAVNQDENEDELKIGNFTGNVTTYLNQSTIIPQKSMCINVTTTNRLHKIEAPGIYSLIGDRYCILRCPEIEQHMYRSKSYESNTMGLAKFTLAVMGYGETRMDFSAPVREFHPIGKLTQMTFRFERPDGSLYNFRGINHTITFNIRYYTPLQDQEFNFFPLNPNYDPNNFRFIQNNTYDDESDTSSETSR